MKIDIKKIIADAGLKDEEQLDEAVVRAKGDEAADINNGGLESQVSYLIKGIKSQKKATEYIKGMID